MNQEVNQPRMSKKLRSKITSTLEANKAAKKLEIHKKLNNGLVGSNKKEKNIFDQVSMQDILCTSKSLHDDPEAVQEHINQLLYEKRGLVVIENITPSEGPEEKIDLSEPYQRKTGQWIPSQEEEVFHSIDELIISEDYDPNIHVVEQDTNGVKIIPFSVKKMKREIEESIANKLRESRLNKIKSSNIELKKYNDKLYKIKPLTHNPDYSLSSLVMINILNKIKNEYLSLNGVVKLIKDHKNDIEKPSKKIDTIHDLAQRILYDDLSIRVNKAKIKGIKNPNWLIKHFIRPIKQTTEFYIILKNDKYELARVFDEFVSKNGYEYLKIKFKNSFIIPVPEKYAFFCKTFRKYTIPTYAPGLKASQKVI